MQPSESQRDTNKSSFAIFLLKLALQAIEKKVEERKYDQDFRRQRKTSK